MYSSIAFCFNAFNQFDAWSGFLSGGLDAGWTTLNNATLLYRPYDLYLQRLSAFSEGMIIIGSILSFVASAYNNFNNPNYTLEESIEATLMDAMYIALKAIISWQLGKLLTKIAVASGHGMLVDAVILGIALAIILYTVWRLVDAYYEKSKREKFE